MGRYLLTACSEPGTYWRAVKDDDVEAIIEKEWNEQESIDRMNGRLTVEDVNSIAQQAAQKAVQAERKRGSIEALIGAL